MCGGGREVRYVCGGGRGVREVCVWWRERGEGGMCVVEGER